MLVEPGSNGVAWSIEQSEYVSNSNLQYAKSLASSEYPLPDRPQPLQAFAQ